MNLWPASGGGASITIGTTTVVGGASGDILYNNAGVIGSVTVVPAANLGTGSSITTKFLRGDNTWQTIPGGGDALTTNPLSQFAATTSLQLLGVMSDETGTGALVFATSPTLVTPILGTPTSGTLTNCTIPGSGITGTSIPLTAADSAMAPFALTDAAPVTIDWSTRGAYSLTVTATRQLQNPTNVVAGTTRIITIIGNSGTSRTITFDTNYVNVPTITDCSNVKAYTITLYARTTTSIVVLSVGYTI